ncbi:MAG: hypothetical protein IPP10_12450 [Candidatus Competibacteraceae bacterium]|nr:hypothetical protein [Candidatus Competibacteraceae bacterium]
MRRALAVGATVGLILGGMLMALLAAGERLVYFPRPLGPSEAQAVLSRHPQAIEVTVPTADGVRLHGWQLPGGDGPARPLVLYFGGNAEEVSWMLEFGTVFTGWDLVLLNYRGYGLSAGNPSQRALLADALTIYDHFTRQPNIDGGRVVVVGRSLGSGSPAIWLASGPCAACCWSRPSTASPKSRAVFIRFCRCGGSSAIFTIRPRWRRSSPRRCG